MATEKIKICGSWNASMKKTKMKKINSASP